MTLALSPFQVSVMKIGPPSLAVQVTIVLLVGAIALLDSSAPPRLSVPILYVVPVLISLWLPNPSAPWWVATGVSLLTVAKWALGSGGDLLWVALADRAVALVVIWATAILCLRRNHYEAELRRVNDRIERQVAERTQELALARDKLAACHEVAVAKLAAIVMSSDDAIIGKSLDGTIMSWNAGAEAVFGYPPAEVLGQSISRLILSDGPDAVSAMLARIAEGGHVRNIETMGIRKDGRRIDLSLTLSPVKDHDGVVIGASTIARDITERKRIESALRESEARFHMMADTAPVMVWMAASDGRLTFVNRQWLEFRGRTLAEELGAGWLDGLYPADRERCVDTFHRALRAEQAFSMEYRVRRADGLFRWVVNTGVPRRDHNGGLAGFIGSALDLTERKEIEDQLRKALKEKESLLREVHHRVKNNLQLISSLLNLQFSAIKDPQVGQLFKECQIRITSIALLHDTLHRSQDLSRIHMAEYVRTLTGHLLRAFGVDREQIRFTMTVEPIEFDLDTGLTCGLIIDELISNCLKHAFSGSKVGDINLDLRANADGTYRLTIEDNGDGIPRDGKLKNPDSLGLDLVALLVDKLDGTAVLESGQGTRWTITFSQTSYNERT